MTPGGELGSVYMVWSRYIDLRPILGDNKIKTCREALALLLVRPGEQQTLAIQMSEGVHVIST